ncbi:MAG: flavin-containing monooxygenase [Chloroflexota bacterium]
MTATAATSAAPAVARPSPSTTVDVLVIGAGQAGLAVGHLLRSVAIRFELVEQNRRIGDSWRQRYDSLSLFTPRSYSHLPGLLLDGDPEGYPTRDEMAAYLERYASHFDIPIRLSTTVVGLERFGTGFIASLDDESTIEARAVVVASGAFQVPAVPAIASGLSPDVKQLTPLSYRNPSSVPAGVVLVVGDGATGRQVAEELATSHRAVLATGKERSLAPQRILGRSIFWWLDHLGLLRLSSDSRLGRRLHARDTIPRRDLRDQKLREAGVELVPRLSGLTGSTATFEDGQSREVTAVVWATGYRDNTSWMHIGEAVDSSGRFIESRGLSPVPNLFFVGRPWQTSQGSALVTGVGADAQAIATRSIAMLG